MAFARDYDNIPLHTDEEYAKTTPFGKLIAPGVMSFMLVIGRFSALTDSKRTIMLMLENKSLKNSRKVLTRGSSASIMQS